MKKIHRVIHRDEFTGTIAVDCSEAMTNIDYFGTVEDALDRYPDAVVHPSLDEETILRVSTGDYVTIEVNNQVLSLSLKQAEQLKQML